VRRGDVFSLRVPKGIGHEQRGKRYGVIVQSDALLPRSVVLIAPTSASARSASFRPEIDIEGTETKVLVEQMGAVDVNRLGDLAGRLTAEDQWGLDAAILTVLGLN
jgi:mRNA interferase MazF